MKRRTLIQAGAGLLGSAALGPALNAQEAFPSKPIKFIIPSAAGSLSDAVARAYAERMSQILKQPILVETMAGAGTLLAMRHMLKSPADGYTLCVSANTIVTLPYVDTSSGFSPSDFTGVSYMAKSPMALVVGADSPLKTINDLIAAAKKAPGTLTYASVGIGTTSHLPVELFAQSAGIKLEMIPYKGIPLAIPDVVSGRVNMMIGTAPTVGEIIKSGRMRALAVTSEKRSPSFPNVPTFVELGHEEASYELFLGLMGLAKLPPGVRKVVADAAEEAKRDPELRSRLESLGQEMPAQTNPEDFNKFLGREAEKMRKLVKAANIQVKAG